ncbi:MAG: hypothetical protein ACXWMX_00910 [Candidatus Limnocylindrales bacterium]
MTEPSIREVLLADTLLGRWLERLRAADEEGRLLPSAVLFVLAFAVYTFINDGRRADLDYFVPLADAFLHGRLGLTEGPSWLNELVPRGGLFYVVYPPMPAIVVLPFVATLGPTVDQARISILFGALNVVLAWNVVSAMGVPRRVAHLLALVFAFGSITWYSAQAGSSWHFAQVSALLFTLLAIRAAQADRAPWLIGLLFAGAALSRLPLLLGSPFFLAYLAERSIRQTRLGPSHERAVFGALGSSLRLRLAEVPPGGFLRFALPFGVALAAPLVLYLLYDQARFGWPFETGYPLIPGLMQEFQYRFGFFSIHSIPRNLYALFLTVPVEAPSFPWVQPRLLGGLSILLTTPLFLWSIRSRGWDWFTVGTWLSVLLVLIPILLHADPGGAQFGFRYGQDLYPFLLLLTARGLGERVGFEAMLAMGLGFVVNLWGMGATYFGWWA